MSINITITIHETKTLKCCWNIWVVTSLFWHWFRQVPTKNNAKLYISALFPSPQEGLEVRVNIMWKYLTKEIYTPNIKTDRSEKNMLPVIQSWNSYKVNSSWGSNGNKNCMQIKYQIHMVFFIVSLVTQLSLHVTHLPSVSSLLSSSNLLMRLLPFSMVHTATSTLLNPPAGA